MKHYIKRLLISTAIIFLFSNNIFSLGAGIQFGGIPGLLINQEEISLENISVNITGTFRMERLPLTLGSGLEFGKINSDSGYGMSIFADYRALDLQLKNTWSFYSGFGTSLKFLTNDFDKWTLAAGARFFAATSWLFYDGYLELYLQQNLVPTYLKVLGNSEKEADFILCLPLEAGIRFHF